MQSKGLFPSIAVAALLGMTPSCTPQQAARIPALEQQKPLVLRGGLLIDGTGRAPLDRSVIVIVGGKIQRVGMEASATVPPEAELINTSGKTIIPGLVDAHSHYKDHFGPLLLYWGVTTVGAMGNHRGWILAQKKAIEKGYQVGPFIMTVGPKLNRPPKPGGTLSTRETEAFFHGMDGTHYVTDEASLEAEISEAKQLGVDAVKLSDRMDPAMMKLATQVAHRHGLPVFAHFTSAYLPLTGLLQGTDEILDTGIDMHVHYHGLIEASVPKQILERIRKGEVETSGYGHQPDSDFRVLLAHLMDTSKFPALAQKMVEKKMFLDIGLGTPWTKFHRFREEADRRNIAFMEGPLGKILPKTGDPAYSYSQYAETYTPYRGKHAEEIAEGYRKVKLFVREFVSRGGKVVVGTDGGTPGLQMPELLQTFHEAGLTPMQVIQAATSWPMEAWRKSQEAGTIEPGKRADLVILNRNPLEDMAAVWEISQVLRAGKIVDREGLARWKDTLLPLPDPRELPVRSPISYRRYHGLIYTYDHIPRITEISPESLPANGRDVPEVILRGENFTRQCLVLFKDHLVPAKFYGQNRLGVVLESGWLREPGTYPLVVVQPGSGGGTSNLFYLIVAPD